MIRPILLPALLFLISCTQIIVTPPAEVDFKNIDFIETPFNIAWSNTIEWISMNKVNIENMDKNSGFILLKASGTEAEEFLNCGKFELIDTMGKDSVEKSAVANIFLKAMNSNSVKVTANISGKYSITTRHRWDGRTLTSKGHCISSGIFENKLFNIIKANKANK